VLTTLAGVGGAIVDYVIGYHLVKGESLTVGRCTLIGKEQLKFAQGWFERYGSAAVFVSRMVPGFRTIISFPAGNAGLRWFVSRGQLACHRTVCELPCRHHACCAGGIDWAAFVEEEKQEELIEFLETPCQEKFFGFGVGTFA